MKKTAAVLWSATCGVAFGSALTAQTPAKVDKVDIVAVTGCLRENPANTWMLVNATDPSPSNANAPSPRKSRPPPRRARTSSGSSASRNSTCPRIAITP